MISLFVHAGAVMYGYTSDLADSDHCGGAQFAPHAEMERRDPSGLGGLAPLPDLILSNIPPSSSSSSPPSPPPSPSSSQQGRPHDPGRPCATPGPKSVACGHGEGVEKGLKHIQEVRLRLLSEPLLPPQQFLPQLSWSLQGRPRALRSRRGERPGGEGGGRQGQWCKVGMDLRKVADQFQAASANKVVTAKRSVTPLNLTVPEVFTRCLSAFVLGLVWWRFFNKMR